MTFVYPLQLARISAKGVVQGVGFRPFVYQLAVKYRLTGWVCNTSEDVRIEVQGEGTCLQGFLHELQTQAPPLARIEKIETSFHPPKDFSSFEIRPSRAEAGKYQLISPDISTCERCLKEILDPQDRRHRYPFTNCTNCGPRFTIIADIPYDRAHTTMRSFVMCRTCQAEYDAPLNRRFHAQPNACPACGPRLQLCNRLGTPVMIADPLTGAARLLQEGKIIAVKGLGGFLLACDATNEEAVALLRRRKKRPAKPLAVMVADMAEAERHCLISRAERKLLAAPECPIVLLKRKEDSPICRSVAPGLKYLGLMLPATPLQHLLVREAGAPLVMTSGNLSEEPICKDNDEAARRLSGIADYFLTHDRDIYSRYDDSVAFFEKGHYQLIRRARGYAPSPIPLTFTARQVLGCGAQEKNTFCLTKDRHAFISQHIGDLENLETLRHFEDTLALYKKLFRIEPEIVAYDLHPEYLSTKYAQDLGTRYPHLKLLAVQHHHAHLVSCLTDNAVETSVIGVACDGTGYGSDGHLWGGEFLLTDYRGFLRVGQLEYLPLPGGEAAIKRPYRTAIGYLLKLLGQDSLRADLAFLQTVEDKEIDIIEYQVENDFNSPLTSSMGRLFDAVSALLGIRGKIYYEGQAAIELEMTAMNDKSKSRPQSYPYVISEDEGINIIRLAGLFSAILADLSRGTPKETIAARFHNTVARMIRDTCLILAEKTNIRVVALSGGVFQNRLLLRKVTAWLERDGLSVLTHKNVPTNDGGISLGQAVIGNFQAMPELD